MIGDVLRALGQLDDPRFRGVLAKGIGITLAILVAAVAGLGALARWLIPDSFTLFGWSFGFLDEVGLVTAVLLTLVASVFLMVPVASAVTGLFLDDVADAVEDRHYPALPRAPRVPFGDAVQEGLGFLGTMVAANIAAFAAYLIVPPAAPFIFLAMNGFLLGREYFQLIAMRRLGRAGARAARRKHAATIWAAGTLMALPLLVPVLNLAVPVIGAATFVHLFHRTAGRELAGPVREQALR